MAAKAQALFTFVGMSADEEFHVYCDHDCSPWGSGSLHLLEDVERVCEDGGYFEPDEIAAVFIAMSFARLTVAGYCGVVKPVLSGEWQDVAPSDCKFRFYVMRRHGKFLAAAYRVAQEDLESRAWSEERLFSGDLAAANAWRAAPPPLPPARRRVRTGAA